MADLECVLLMTQDGNAIYFSVAALPDDMPVQPHVCSRKFSKWRNKQNRNDPEDKWLSGLSFSSISLLDFLLLRQVKIMWIILLPIRLEKKVKEKGKIK